MEKTSYAPGGRRLTQLYILALGTVALLSIVGQILVQTEIASQIDDSTVINMAGRQRMLSQRIVMSALALGDDVASEQSAARRRDLQDAVEQWTESLAALRSRDGSQGLRGYNSAAVRALYEEIEHARVAMTDAARSILAGDHQPSDESLRTLLDNEHTFLSGMERIVSQYEVEATARVSRLRRTELVLLGITLTVLLLEGLFIFRPAVRRIQQTLRKLGTSELRREEVSAELSTIFDSVPALILYHDLEGKILRVNRSGAEIIGESLYRLHRSSIFEWFPAQEARFREENARIVDTGKPVLGLLHYMRNSQDEIRSLRMNKVPYTDLEGNVIGVIVFAVDISAHKRLERKLMELRTDEERRLSYNLHDGLGQHLSGILYLARRLVNRLDEKAGPEQEQAAEIMTLVRQSVESVRDLSKSLRPIGDDPGALADGLAELARSTQENTGIECSFEEDGSVLIFEADMAEHLYRIAQEAVNNAVRHGRPKRIDIRLTQGDDETTLEVRDDGTGFGDSSWKQARLHGRDPEGLGLGIMEHRSELLGGRFSISSEPGKGTVARCVVEV